MVTVYRQSVHSRVPAAEVVRVVRSPSVLVWHPNVGAYYFSDGVGPLAHRSGFGGAMALAGDDSPDPVPSGSVLLAE